MLIAEVGLNHNGSIDRAMEMIRVAKGCGADVVKFQTFKADEFCSKEDPLYPVFKRCELSDDAWPTLADECVRQGIEFMSTPQNYSDLQLILPYIRNIKVGSDDCANVGLLEKYASHGFPLIVSTGMATEAEISTAAQYASVLLVCTSQYPCPDSEARVSRVATMARFGKVGFSDHTLGNEAAVMAVAYGATVFEKHFTLDHNFAGPDHAWACEPEELASWCTAIRRAQTLQGEDALDLTPSEAEQRRKYQRQSGQQIRGTHADRT